VVGFPTGFGLDVFARTMQGKMEAALGQPIVVQNMPGDIGNIANGYVASAAPNGYTLLLTASNIGVFPLLKPNMSYDPVKAFAFIGEVSETPILCVVRSDFPINTIADLVKEAKANPGQMKFCSEGTGAPSHLIVDLIAKLNDMKLTRVAFEHV
jgi:tripartite-type tricarboxylate transporter receptor subunit TctC